MAAYYYLAASLPMLATPDQEPPVSSDDMLEVCRRFMTEKDYEGLVVSTLDPGTGEAPWICREFHAWERSLRNSLVALRAAEQELDEDQYLRDVPDVFGTSAIAGEAMGKATPLEAELFLDGSRWAYIEDLAYGHFFDVEFLRAYRLKLQLLERRALFEEERGFAAYRDLYSRVLEASGTEIPVGGGNV